jgi:hypothetical protein
VHVVPGLQPGRRQATRDLVGDRGVRGRARAVRPFREDLERFADSGRRDESIDVGLEPREERPSRAEDTDSGRENRERQSGGRKDGDASNLVALRLRLDRQISRIRRLAFVPPNPKEFDRATGSFLSRAVFGV